MKKRARGVQSVPLHFLGGMTAEKFLRDHWQKRPLLVKDAMPGFEGLLTPDELAGLSCMEEAQSRLVRLERGRWHLDSGPFDEGTFRKLGRASGTKLGRASGTKLGRASGTKWSLLVQGVNHFLPEAERLLAMFSFIPHARLDDLMVSYAPRGGSVGPHFDSYDVFLIQGQGHRRWQVSEQDDMTLVEGAPLRILREFAPDGQWVLGPGDLLYLPPRYAHYGVAEDECMTYSVGFRAPTAHELAVRFLEWLPDHLTGHLPGAKTDEVYADPDLRVPAHPSEVGDDMVARVGGMLDAIKWDREMVGRFLGHYLSEPKSHIIYERPARPVSRGRFDRSVAGRGVELALASQMLMRGGRFYLNGEELPASAHRATHATLLRLADDRRLPPATYPEPILALLHGWYVCGYLVIAD